MFTSPIQSKVASKDCHHKSNSVNKWWVMDSTATKTLLVPSSILRSCSGILIKYRLSNLNLQSLSSVLNLTQWLIPVLSGSSPNKLINADCRADAVFLKARCIAGY